MNKYEVLGRIAEAEDELKKSRTARQLLTEQIYGKSKDLMVRRADISEAQHYEMKIHELEILLENLKEKHQEVQTWQTQISELQNL